MNFQQLILILWSRKVTALSALAVTVITTLLISLVSPKEYISTVALVIDQHHINPVTGVSLPVQLVDGYMATQVDMLGSHNIAKKVVHDLKLVKNKKLLDDFTNSNSQSSIEDWLAEYLLEDIEILPSRESSLIKISATATDPQLAADIANAFANVYILTNIELRAEPAKQSAIWFDKQKEVLRQRLVYVQNELSNVQREHGIISAGKSLDLEKSKLTDLSEQLVKSQANTSELQSKINQINTIVAKRGSYQSLHEVLRSPFIQSLKSDLARAESRFAELAKRIGKNHPHYIQARAEVASLKRKISSEVKIVIDGISSSTEASLQKDKLLITALAEQKQKVLALKDQYDGTSVLNREVEIAQQAYDEVLHKTIQAQMKGKITQSNVAILNPAIVPSKHSKPKVLLNVILSIFLGALLGIGAALFIEFRDRRVRSSLDITNSLDIPVFAILSGNSNVSDKKLIEPEQNTEEAVMKNPFSSFSLDQSHNATVLSEQHIATIESAVNKLSGAKRRAFKAQVTVDYLNSNPHMAEKVLGWKRKMVELGLHELRTGIICVYSYKTYGSGEQGDTRRRLIADICSLAEPDSPTAPRIKTAFQYELITAKDMQKALMTKKGWTEEELPNEKKIQNILNHLGYQPNTQKTATSIIKDKKKETINDNPDKAKQMADLLRMSSSSKS